MKKVIFLTTIYLLFTSCSATSLVAKGTIKEKITILDQAILDYGEKKGVPFLEISDLTYNSKTKQLHMVGDRGYFYTFSANFREKIENLKFLNAFPIKETNNKTITPDSEGLTHNSKGDLIISFERKPRVSKINSKGKIQSNYKLPKKLQKRSSYKTPNSMFEGIAFHPKHGILTAAEYPINRQKNTQQTIYALSGKEWHFKAESHANSAITALEVMDDNNLLVIERAYSGLSNPFYITLKKVYLNRCDKKKQCQSEVLASLSSFEGWGFNNFEGLAKVGKNRYVMVSDNNDRSILPTVLTYFKVNP